MTRWQATHRPYLVYPKSKNIRVSYSYLVSSDNILFYPSILDAVNEKLEEFVNTISQEDLKEYGKSFGYDKIENEMFDIIDGILFEKEQDENLYIELEDFDKLIDAIRNAVDYDALYEIIDSIYDSPVTMAEKLADIGMSYNDFL